MGLFGNRRSGLRDVDYMTLIPVQRQAAEVDGDAGRVTVLMPRYGDPVLGRLLQPRLPADKRFIRIPLEHRGAFLWRLIDGQRTVADLVRAYRERYPHDSEDAPNRVALFMQAMYENKFICYDKL